MKNNLLATARKRAGLTQAQIAEKIGVTEQAYRRYELGTRMPNIAIGLKIAMRVGEAIPLSTLELFGVENINPDN